MFDDESDEAISKIEEQTAKDKVLEKEIHKHRYIKVKMVDKVLLFLALKLGSCFPLFACWKRGRKFKKMYETGQERLEKELNIVKILRSLRFIKILMKNSLMSPQVKFEIKHSGKNLIVLDETQESDSDDDVKNLSLDDSLQTFEDNLPKPTSNPDDILKNLKKNILARRPKSIRGLKHMSTMEKKEVITSVIINNRHPKYTEEEAGRIITKWA